MKFNEFYDLVVENNENVVEEGFFNKLKVLLTMAVLGWGYSSYKELQSEYNRLKVEEPERLENAERLASQIEQRKEQIVQNPEMLNGVVENPQEVVEIIKTNTSSPQKQLITPDKKQAAEIINADKKSITPEQKQQFFEKAWKYIEKNENSDLVVRTKWYDDNKGYPTIGVGHLVVLPDDIKNGVLKKGEYKLDKKGNVTSINITPARGYEIFYNDLINKLKDIARHIPDFDYYPEPLKIVILDGYLRGDMSKSKKTKAIIRTAMNAYFENNIPLAKKYLNMAANEYLDNDEYRKYKKTGIGKRMYNNAKIIRSTLDENFDENLLTKNVYD